MENPKPVHPKFRPDILVHRHEEGQGESSLILEDPVAGKFFKISDYEFDLLKVLDGTLTVSEAIDKLKIHGRHFTESHVTKLMEQYARSGLLLGTGYGTAKVQSALYHRMKREMKVRSPLKLYYLYLPLFNPDKFLERTLPLFKPLINKWTLLFIAAFVPGAVYLLAAGWPRMNNEISFFFNLSNLIFLWLAIALVKIVHEFSHAYTAKYFGTRVPEMGLAFIIFFPVLYCNTTTAWQLGDRKQRMAISAAGIFSEFAVAVFATYLWYFSKPGVINSVAFYLMAISVISSLLFNGNPLMKFDGYFVLSDLLRIPNLQGRAFIQMRYLFLNRVLGIDSVTGTAAPKKDRKIIVTYGFSALVYRFFLYSGIVAGVYYRFDKTVGLILGTVIFFMLVVFPISKGIKNLYSRKSEIHPRIQGVTFFGAGVLLLIIALSIPWANKSSYPCYLETGNLREIVLPAEAPVEKTAVRQGDHVKEGETLFILDASVLTHALKTKEADLSALKKEIEIIENSEKDLSKLETKFIEISQMEDSIKQLKDDVGKTEYRAPFDGALTKISDALQPGARPGKGTIVGEISSVSSCEVLGIVPETDVAMLHVGSKVDVWFPVDTGKTYHLTIRDIGAFSTQDLEGSPFSSRFGGEIPTEALQEKGKDAPIEPYYLCKMDFSNTDGLLLGTTGRLLVREKPRSAFRRALDSFYRTFYRETVF